MDTIEFIDLSGVEEAEKNWILRSLRAWDPNVQVPWRKGLRAPVKATVPLDVGPAACAAPIQTCNGPVVAVAAANVVLPRVPQSAVVPLMSPQHRPVYHPSYHHHVACYRPISTAAPAHVPYTQHVYPYHPTVVSNYVYTTSNMNSPTPTYTATPQLLLPEVEVPREPVKEDQPKEEPAAMECNGMKTTTEPVEEGGGGGGGGRVVAAATITTLPTKKTWASLFESNKATAIANVVGENGGVEVMKTAAVPATPVVQNVDVNNHVERSNAVEDNAKCRYNEPIYYRIGDLLSEHVIDHRTISLQPRGLINRSNYCYINSILQALVACPPVYNLLVAVADTMTSNAKRKHIPVIDNMAKFVKEFQHLPAAQRVSRRVDKNAKQDPNSLINCDVPFEPGYIYKMLNGMRSDTFVVEGRQEDAEEFLGCLLNGLNDEMLELMKLVGKQRTKSVREVTIDDGDSKEWQVMGPKNKGCVTRRIDVIQTPLSDVFNGHLRSRLHRTGDKCTDNIQPFFTLQLNIEKVSTVRDALEALVCKNQLEGVTSSKTNQEVEAWQQVTIEELPYILVLHLKCFDYKLDGCTKIIKALEFPIDLKIDSKLLSSKNNYSSKEKQYKLFAVVYHDGKEASKGHYLTDAYHVGYARWLRYDDATVKPVLEEHVLKPHGTRVPYLLFYRRSDSIRGK